MTVNDGANTSNTASAFLHVINAAAITSDTTATVMEAGGVDNGTPGTFTVQTVDGTQQVVTTTIDGANYTPVALTSGDVIDLSALLDANFGASSNIADFVRVTQTGSNVTVQVDPDGAAGRANFSDVAILSGYGTANPDPVIVYFAGANHTLTA